MLLQRKIDDVLEGVRLADLLLEESRRAHASVWAGPVASSPTLARCRSFSSRRPCPCSRVGEPSATCAARQRRSSTALFREPDAADVEWLAATATRGDLDHARWELRYARRALGLITAQRDALDDRTASIVARAICGVASAATRTSPRRWRKLPSASSTRASARIAMGSAAKAGAPTPGSHGADAVRVRRRQLHAPGREHRSGGRAARDRTSPRRTRRSERALARPRFRRRTAVSRSPRWSADRPKGPSSACNRASVVPKGGLEPPRACAHWLLKPARLPVPPLRQEGKS